VDHFMTHWEEDNGGGAIIQFSALGNYNDTTTNKFLT